MNYEAFAALLEENGDKGTAAMMRLLVDNTHENLKISEQEQEKMPVYVYPRFTPDPNKTRTVVRTKKWKGKYFSAVYTSFKKTHHYSRMKHFKDHLYRVTGQLGSRERVYKVLIDELKSVRPRINFSSRRVYERVRKHVEQKHYKNICNIIRKCGRTSIKIKETIVDCILNDFNRMSLNFSKWLAYNTNEKKYFPPINYIMWELIDLYGVELPYDVVRVRTKKNIDKMANIFSNLFF